LANDTIEHITDFDSAQDHVQTLLKWQEMGVAMSISGKRTTDPSRATEGGQGVFERMTDSTRRNKFKPYQIKAAKEEDMDKPWLEKAKEQEQKFVNGKRWKHQGPWLASMDAKAFTKYATRILEQRREDFQKYFRDYIHKKVIRSRLETARNAGIDPDSIDSSLSSEDLRIHYRLFRQDLAGSEVVQSELISQIIIPFLDHPPVGVDANSHMAENYSGTLGHGAEPLSTHPSAGLSYLRSNTHVYNHPLLGPQRFHAPLPARVLVPSQMKTRGRGRAVLGVAGVAAEDEDSTTMASYNDRNPVAHLDTETEGGKKIWVSPVRASIAPDGKINLQFARAALDAVGVGLGQVEEAMPPGVLKAPVITGLEGARLDETLV
jgi:hypothetical protein